MTYQMTGSNQCTHGSLARQCLICELQAEAIANNLALQTLQHTYDSRLEEVKDENKQLREVHDAALDLYDNRLGWSDGRNPYAPPSFWTKLGKALGK